MVVEDNAVTILGSVKQGFYYRATEQKRLKGRQVRHGTITINIRGAEREMFTEIADVN